MALGVAEMFNTLPIEFTVLHAYPNPYNLSVTIRYGLEHDNHAIV